MAYGIPVLDITLRASADLTDAQYCFAVVNTDGDADLAGAGETAVGVIQNKPGAATGAEDEAAAVRVYGVTKVVCGGTVTAGSFVGSDDAGSAVVAEAGGYVVGIALMSGEEDEIISVLLTHSGVSAANGG